MPASPHRLTERPHAFARPRVALGVHCLAPPALGIDPESVTLADIELRQALAAHAQHGGEVLDLSAHGEALRHGADELMECFGDACRRAQRLPKVLHLPAGLAALPAWVAAFPSVEYLTAPGLVDAAAPAPLALAA